MRHHKTARVGFTAVVESLEIRRMLSDVYEPNNSLATATDFGTLGSREEVDTLDIDPSGDQDFFKFTAAGNGNVYIRISFISFFGDLDLHLYGPSGNLVATSDGNGNTEEINYDVVGGQTYTINVAGFQGATNSYDLLINGPDSSGGSGDRFEPNDDFAGATDLGVLGDRVENDLSIHQANNDDYYKFTAAASGNATVGITFADSSGDLDMDMYNGSQQLLLTSDSSGDSESITQSVTAGQQYYVRVYGFNGATNPQYNLSIDAPGALTGMSYESETRQAVTFNFNADVHTTFDRSSFTLDNLTTSQTVSPAIGNFSFNAAGDQATLVLTNLLPDANYRVTAGTSQLNFAILAADANGDSSVDTVDFMSLSQHFNQSSSVTFYQGDFNYDGIVNALDFNNLATQFGTGLAAPTPGSSRLSTSARLPSGPMPKLFADRPIGTDPGILDDVQAASFKTTIQAAFSRLPGEIR